MRKGNAWQVGYIMGGVRAGGRPPLKRAGVEELLKNRELSLGSGSTW